MPFDNSKAVLVLPVVCNVLGKWQCSHQVKAALLGFSSKEEFELVTSNPDEHEFTSEQVQRMSYILNIYRSLHSFFTESKKADDWVNKPNSAEIFGGQSALELMLSGELGDLAKVSNYLKSF